MQYDGTFDHHLFGDDRWGYLGIDVSAVVPDEQ